MADAELRVAITGDASQLQATIASVEAQLTAMNANFGKFSGTKLPQTNVAAVGRDFVKVGTDIEKFGRSLNTVTKPLQYAALGLAAGGVAAAKFAIDFENNFANVRKTVDGTDEELNKIKQDIIDMTTVGINGHNAIPQTTEELTELAMAGGQLGIETKNISAFTETMAMMGTATNLVGEEGAATLARFMNVTNTSQEYVGNLGSAIVDLGNHFATTENELTTMGLRMGSILTNANFSPQEILAYSTALSSLGVEAEAGGSSLSRIVQNIQRFVSEGGAKLQQLSNISGKTASEFKSQWEENASDALKSFLEGFNKLTNYQQVSVLDMLGINNVRDIKAINNLAGDKGIELLNNALERSKNAWAENSALMTEFNRKAETTASKIQVAKNNIVEAGRSIGEAMLPALGGAATKVSEFAQGLAKMDDGTKSTLLTVGKWVIGLGAVAKIGSSATIGIGSLVRSVVEIKEGIAEGGMLAKLAPILSGIAPVAGYAALGIGALTAAVVVSKKAYDAWYTSNYQWTAGLSEQDEKITESVGKLKALNDAQERINNDKLVIENPESSQGAIDKAKADIEDIKKLLEETYNIKINADTPDMAGKGIEAEQAKTRTQIYKDMSAQKKALGELRTDYLSYQSDYAELDSQYTEAIKKQEEYAKVEAEIQDIYNSTDYKTLGEKQAAAQKLLKDELGMSEQDFARSKTAIESTISFLLDKMENLKGSYYEYKALSESISNQTLELMGMAVKEGDSESVEKYFAQLKQYIEQADLDWNGYAMKVSDTLNGIDFETAKQRGEEALNNWINDYVTSAQRLGGDMQTIVSQASAFALGFSDVGTAIQNVGLDEFNNKVNTLAHLLYEIPENTTIKVAVDDSGAVYTLTEVEGKITRIDGQKASVSVNADGNIDVLNEAGEKVGQIDGKNLSISVNANGNIDVLNEAGEKVGEIQKNGVVNVQENVDVTYTKTEQELPDPKDAAMTYKKVDQELPDPKDADLYYKRKGQDDPENKIAIVTYVSTGQPKAKGSKNFSGGLAVINDQKGISDPRELVKIGNKGYIFDGKDVTVALPPHAQIFTAEQTKRIMGSLPHFASGTNNEAWEADKNAWQHRQRISLVELPAEEYLSWIEEMREKYADTVEVMEELDEDYTDALKQQIKERQDALKKLDEASDTYIKLRGAFNDWDEIGDSLGAAYWRVSDRAVQAFNDGLMEAEEVLKRTNDVFENLIDNQDKFSTDWIRTQTDYYGMTASEEYSAQQRRLDNLHKFMGDVGTLTEEQYAKAKALEEEITKDMYDSAEKIADAWRDDADWYRQQAEVYGWGFNGTGQNSEFDFWQDVLDKELALSQNTDLSINDRQNALRKADEARMKIYQARSKELDEAMSDYNETIGKKEQELNKQVSDLRESWTVKDRRTDMASLEKQLSYYKNAVTKEGQDKYKSLQEEYKRLQREEEVYKLEQKNSKIIEGMRARYDEMESNKQETLDILKADLFRTAEYDSGISSDVADVAVDTGNIDADIKSVESVVSAGLATVDENTLTPMLENIKGVNGVAKLIYAYLRDADFGNTEISNTFNVSDNVDVRAAANVITYATRRRTGAV